MSDSNIYEKYGRVLDRLEDITQHYNTLYAILEKVVTGQLDHADIILNEGQWKLTDEGINKLK